jgi:hypothetical protein
MNAQTLEASFQIDPEALAEGISAVQTDVPRAGNTKYNKLYLAAIDGTTNLASEQMVAEEAGLGRVVLGMVGIGHNHVFFDLPAISVEEPGELVCKRADSLKEWAQACTDVAELEYHAQGNKFALHLYHGEGRGRGSKKMEVTEQNPGKIRQAFPAKEHRFAPPKQDFSDEEVAEMLSMASDLAPSSSSGHRPGDLIFDGGEAEFVTKEVETQHTVTTRQRVESDLPIENLEWEVMPEHLSVLQSALKEKETTGRFTDRVGSEDGKKGVLQLQYPKAVGHAGETGYVHRQLHVFREEEPLKSWITTGKESDFFDHPACKLFSTIVVRPLMQALSRTWAIEPTATITAEPESGEKANQLKLKSGDYKDPDVEYVQATLGESEIEEYVFDPHGIDKIEAISQGRRMIQIASHPSEKGELPNGFVAVPTGGDNPTEIPSDPDRYVIVKWNPA